MIPVYITWLDAEGCSAGWDHDMKLKKKYSELVHTLGFRLDENDDFVLVAGHVVSDQAQGAVAIPKDMIRNYWELSFD